mgnify:CR=1 FL=1
MSKKETKPEENKEQETVNETEDTAVDTEVEEKKEPTVEDQLADMKKQLAYTAAEYANFRARSAKEKEQTYSNAKGNVIAEILPVIDNLERAIASVDGKVDENDPLLKGVKMTDKQLKEILAAMGVEEIKALGEKFDPNLHAAVAHVEDENFGENEVVLDMMKGYKYKEKVIRHSMVKVAN